MMSPLTRQLIGDKSRARWADPAYRERVVARIVAQKAARKADCAKHRFVVILTVRQRETLRRIGEAMAAQGYQAQVL